MMKSFENLSEDGLCRLAGSLSDALTTHDAPRQPLFLALHAPLGGGKTTFARAFIRARLQKRDHDITIPSPTFTLTQGYDCEAYTIRHHDFYRLARAEEALEALEESLLDGISLIEWADRLQEWLPERHLDIRLTWGKEDALRHLTLSSTHDEIHQWLEKIIFPRAARN